MEDTYEGMDARGSESMPCFQGCAGGMRGMWYLVAVRVQQPGGGLELATGRRAHEDTGFLERASTFGVCGGRWSGWSGGQRITDRRSPMPWQRVRLSSRVCRGGFGGNSSRGRKAQQGNRWQGTGGKMGRSCGSA